MRKCKLLIVAAAAMAVCLESAAAAQKANGALRVVALDVEGGSSTLYVTPQGHSLLVDTGWLFGQEAPPLEPGAPSSAQRILAAAKSLGVTKIDYLLITHYHNDHVGGLFDLISQIPIGVFVDHGPNRQTDPLGLSKERLAILPVAMYARYEAAIAGRPRIVMKPGDTITIDALKITAVDSDGKVIGKALPGGGRPNPLCATVLEKPWVENDENPRSLGFVASYGKVRILSLGDSTWHMENKMACPVGLLGPIDLLITTHHGSNASGSPAFLPTVTPTVAITANGATKGGDAEIFDLLRAQPSIKDIWQVHSGLRAPTKNPPEDLIANPAGAPDHHLPIIAAVEASGRITVTNPRNQVSRTYPQAKRAGD